MGKELIVNQTLDETRVSLIENGEILDYLVDRTERTEKDAPSVGNVYKGRVIRVLPGMQSAFIDIGFDRAAFLYVDDAYIPTLEEQREMAEKSQKMREDELQAKEAKGEIIPDELSTLSELSLIHI